MQFPEMKFSVKILLNLLNLLRGCKSATYGQKILNTLNRFNKMAYLLRNVKRILLRVLRDKRLNISVLYSFNSSTFFLSQFQNSYLVK